MRTLYSRQFVTAVETKTKIANSAAIFVANKSAHSNLNAQPENQIFYDVKEIIGVHAFTLRALDSD